MRSFKLLSRTLLLGFVLSFSTAVFAKTPPPISQVPIKDKAAVFYIDTLSTFSMVYNLIYNVIRSDGSTNKQIVFTYPSANYLNYAFPFDVANFKNANGQVDNYVVYPNMGNNSLDLVKIPNHDFTLRTTQQIPYTFSAPVGNILSLRLEIGKDSAGRPMPVVAIHFNTLGSGTNTGTLTSTSTATATGTGTFPTFFSTIELIYFSGTWHSLYNSGTSQLANRSFNGNLGLTLDTGTNGTVGASVVFYKLSSFPITATSGLVSLDYNFTGTPAVGAPVFIPGSNGNNSFTTARFSVSNSFLIIESFLPSPFGSFHCSSRVAGQPWSALSQCLTNTTNATPLINNLGLGGNLSFISIALATTPASPSNKDLYFQLIDSTNTVLNPIFSLLVDGGSKRFDWTSIAKDFGNSMFYVLALRNQGPNNYLDLYGINPSAGPLVQFFATVDNLSYILQAKILPLD